jgi:CheY-like chemotaxis protein
MAAPKVLVVEDDRQIRSAYGRMLSMLNCDSTLCMCPGEALPLLEGGFRPDLILSDLEMPRMDGDEFCEIVRARYPEIPVVLISGNMEVFRIGTACGATKVFLKPMRPDDLRRLIEETCPA